VNSLRLVRAGRCVFSLRYLISADDYAEGPVPDGVAPGTIRIKLQDGDYRDFLGPPADAIRRALDDALTPQCEADVVQGAMVGEESSPCSSGPALATGTEAE
jgi:hypothetical protein